MSENYHVHPVDDLREHTNSTKCWCNPTTEAVFSERGDAGFVGTIIVHHSMDRREEYENGRKMS